MARKFLWDPSEDNVIAEFDDDHNLIVEYTTEPERYGDVISQRRDGETNCFYSDGLGSTTEVTNGAGGTIATRAYTSYGEITETTGDLVFPFQYIGQKGYYCDIETGNYNIRRRCYNPPIARWLSVDPAMQFVSDEYVFCRNNPNSFNDPSGMVINCLIYFNWLGIVFGYGKYCGYLNTPTEGCTDGMLNPDNPPPVDGLDRACAKHDCCLHTIADWIDPRVQYRCHLKLCTEVSNPALCDDAVSRLWCRAVQLEILFACHAVSRCVSGLGLASNDSLSPCDYV